MNPWLIGDQHVLAFKSFLVQFQDAFLSVRLGCSCQIGSCSLLKHKSLINEVSKFIRQEEWSLCESMLEGVLCCAVQS